MRTLWSCLVILPMLLFLSACIGGTTPPSRYYLLSPDPDMARDNAVPAPRQISLAIGPVVIPPHLKRLQIVTKKTRHQLNLAEFDLWAEPLDQNMSRILVENLSTLLGTDEIFKFEEQRGTPVDYAIAVDVEKMEAILGEQAELVVRWTVVKSKGRQHVFTRRSRYSAPLQGSGFEEIAAAMSRNVGELSVEIATGLGQLAN